MKTGFGLVPRLSIMWIAAVLACALARCPGAGVTLVTHGFAGNVTDWVLPMCYKIPQYRSFPGTNFTLYQISITQTILGGYTYSQAYLEGVSPLASDSGEILVALDWSTISSGTTPTTDVAAQAAAALLDPSLIPELKGRALAELPLHLIGHSRGGSVVTEMARYLGAQGVWVDQVSTLDPHPVSFFGDPAVTNYANIFFADNYWQDLGDGLFVPNGQAVPGAYNRQLTILNDGYSSTHSDVHLWYHGTIDLATPASDTGATITSAMRTNWWTALEAAGTNAGFLYDAIGGGNRLSTLEPAGAGNGRIVDGMNQAWDFGAGASTNRTALPSNNGAWPNVPLLSLLATNALPAGQQMPVACYFQFGSNSSAGATLSLFLDPDPNPYNGNEAALTQRVLAGTGTASVFYLALNAAADAATVRPGSYWIGARLSDGQRTRYAYAARKVTLSPSLQAPALLASRVRNGLFTFTISGFPSQRVAVDASTNLAQWVALRTNTMPGALLDFADPDSPAYPARSYRARLVP